MHATRRGLLVSLLLAAAPAVASGKDTPKPAGKPGKASPASRAEAVARAMKRLDEDAFASESDMNEQHKVFTRAIAGLDFLLDPAAGKGAVHPDRVERCAECLGKYVDGAEKRFAGKAEKAAGDDEMSAFAWSQTTWALSAAAIFYAEELARGVKKADAAARLRTIGDLLAKSQQPDGGFGHDKDGRPRIPEIPIPQPGGGTEMMKYPATLLSASNWASFALGLCRPVSGKKLDAAIAKAKGYYKASVNLVGSYPYDPSQREPKSAFDDPTGPARTAGSYVALRSLGVPAKDASLAKTADYLKARVDDFPEGHGSAPHGVFFGAIATLEIGGEARAQFEKAIWPRLLAAQDLDPAEGGAFDCICKHSFAATCESWNGEDEMSKMMGPTPPTWRAWKRAYTNALNLFALLAEKGKLRLLDGVPADATPAGDTTPGDPPAGSPPK